MPHLDPLTEDDVRDLDAPLTTARFVLGFTPNSLLTLARRPQLVEGWGAISKAVFGPGGTVSPDLKMLVAYISSSAAHCGYCQAHSATSALRVGVTADKMAAAAA